MFHEHLNLTDDALSAASFLAPLTGKHTVQFNVLEDEMLVEIGFDGVLLMDGLATLVELGFEIDKAAVLPSDKLWAYSQGVADTAAELRPVSLKRAYRLSAGRHTVTLLGKADGGAPALNGAVYKSRMTIKKVSNTDVVAANANVKRQSIH